MLVVDSAAGSTGLCPNHDEHGAVPQAMDRAIAGTDVPEDHVRAARASATAPGVAGLSQQTMARNAEAELFA